MFDPLGQINPWSLGSFGVSQPLGMGMQTLAGIGSPYTTPGVSPWLQGIVPGVGQIGPQTWLGNPALLQVQHLLQQAQQIAQQVPQLAQQIPQLIQQNPQIAQQAPQLQFLPQLLQQASNLAQQIPSVLQQVATTGLGMSPYTQGIGFGQFGLSPLSQLGGYGRPSPFAYGVGYGSHPFA